MSIHLKKKESDYIYNRSDISDEVEKENPENPEKTYNEMLNYDFIGSPRLGLKNLVHKMNNMNENNGGRIYK